ncbi:MAG: hypothetical protein SGPRY_005028 [Prymnesium sp.]
MEACDLCVVGAGYAGVNAFNAASKYLTKGARVVVVAEQSRWGGQWVEQYDFVRLHQAYQLYTAGEREWAISGKRPWSYLATKKEILQHFEDVVEANVSEKELQLVPLFQYKYGSHSIDDGKVRLVVNSLLNDEGVVPPPVSIIADRMIVATGVNIPRKLPIHFSSPVSTAVHSLCPADILSPKWHPIMKYSKDADKPIWIIGSGKTAMDVICLLSKQEPSWLSRLRCVAGRGTWFMDRAMVDNPIDADGNLLPVYFVEMCAMFNGSNAHEVYQELSKKGFFHSYVEDAQNFVAGIASKEEIATCKSALSPASERISRCHLIDIEQSSEAGLRMKLRSLDGQTIDYKSLEPGSFIVNCTDNVIEGQLDIQPIVSDDGLVLVPQNPLRHSGLSAHLQTHAWYLGLLDGVWQQYIVNPPWNYNQKDSFMLQGIVGHNTRLVSAVLPKEVLAQTKGLGQPPGLPAPTPEWLARVKECTALIAKRHEAMDKARYTDKKDEMPLNSYAGM